MTTEEVNAIDVGTRIIGCLHTEDKDPKWRGTVTKIKEIVVEDLDYDETSVQTAYVVRWDEPHRYRENNGSLTLVTHHTFLADELEDFYEILK